jgi:ribosomal protein L3
MGGDNVTVMNLEVVRVEEEHNLMVVRGAIPGARGAYLTIRRHYGVPKVVAAPAGDDKSKKKKKG